MKFGEMKHAVMPVISNKKYQWVLTIAILAMVLFLSCSIRLSNWDLLTDHTTGEKIPLALDPYYFLRIAETIAATGGDMPAFDEMRGPGFETAWHPEIMPNVVVGMWKAANIFGDYSLRAVNVFSPVFFYGIGLILFFFLTFVLTRSKLAGVLASSFLAFNPAYLYRTMAGFSDHEAIGMVGFFAALLGFSLAMKYLDSLNRRNLVGAGLTGGLIGLLTAFTIACWGGVSVFLFMIIPISFLLFWVVRTRDTGDVLKDNGVMFYLSWMVFTVVFGVMLGYGASSIVSKFLSSNGIISAAVFGLVVVDRILMFLQDKIRIEWYDEKYRILYSVGILCVVGVIVLPFLGKNFFSLVWETLNRLLNPLWGATRLDITVAENAQPYLINWIGNMGAQLFWLFVAGAVLIGVKFSEKIKSHKNRYLMIFGFVTMSFGILFSRISADSILKGNGIFSLSGLVYLGGVGIFLYAFFKNYFNKEMKINTSIIVLFSWMFVMLVVGRSTTRLFFVIATFVCLAAGYFISEMGRIWISHKGKWGELSKVFVVGLLIMSVIAGGIGLYTSHSSIATQAKYTSPSANTQWQGAMSWVRENTSEDSTFAHWWDYGYWVQTLGERATVADGGHCEGAYDGDFKIGRYVLTTPNPYTALSFFKTLDVDYLLIDPTDLGKYPAYSKIGGGNDEAGLTWDRYSAIPVMPNDPKQTQETANGTVVVFSGGMPLFEDIVYNKDGKNIFLPAEKAAVIGIVMNFEGNGLKQPEAVYYYNGVQTRLPIRYVYMNGELVDFKSGLEVVIDIIPGISGQRVNRMGAAIYLSQKVSKSLFAQLYLLDDAFGNYESVKVVHIEDDQVVASLKAQGASNSDFVYYNGFRGPIKIWDVSEIPNEINVVPEFKEGPVGEYGTLDDLQFSSLVATGEVGVEILGGAVEERG